MDARDLADATARIEALEQRVAELTALLERTAAPATASMTMSGSAPVLAPATPSDERSAPGTDGTASRRGMLKLAGAAAIGAVATGTAGTAGRAAADSGQNMVLGNAGATGDTASSAQQTVDQTRFDYTGSSTGIGFLFKSGTSFTNSDSTYSSALGGWATSSATPHGFYGYTNQSGYGVIARSASSGRAGLLARGVKANVELFAEGAAGPLRAGDHNLGEIVCDLGGDVWICVVAGTPGTWRKLAGPSTGGAYHAITPTRAYDSRLAAPTGGVGRVANNTNRLIDVSNRRNQTTGAVEAANVVPVGATAVTANVTVADTQGAGFLAINPGGDTTVNAAAINWSASGQILNNGLNLTLNDDRSVTIIGGGGGSTHVVIDVTGYFR